MQKQHIQPHERRSRLDQSPLATAGSASSSGAHEGADAPVMQGSFTTRPSTFNARTWTSHHDADIGGDDRRRRVTSQVPLCTSTHWLGGYAAGNAVTCAYMPKAAVQSATAKDFSQQTARTNPCLYFMGGPQR